jgi:NAD(P)H-flavin reductase
MDPMLPHPHRVRRLIRESHDTFTLELARVGDDPSPRFAPGQFNMLYAFGAGEVPISISSDPGRSDVLAHTTRVVGGVTGVLARLRRGGTIGVRGPFGNGWPLDRASGRDVILVAGGIGLAPLRSLAYALVASRRRYGRIALAYGARTPEDLLFGADLERWRTSYDVEVEVTVDRATEAWPGRVGVVTALLRRLSFDPSDAVAMICGPEVMMRYAAAALVARGVDAGSIFVAMERNMKCAVGFCGHCMFGHVFICRDGPVLPFERIERMLGVAEL